MAGNNIKGITISLGADTTQLTSALKDVDKQSKSLTNELKAVDKALKLDPSNVELAAQRQEVLTEAVQSTSKRLEVLKQAQAQVEEQFRNGNLGVEQYRAFQRELSTTEAQLKAYENQIASSVADQTRLAQSSKELTTFFKATGTEVGHFADVLGSRLTNAIREGSANADQMGRALQLMGRHALGANADIDQMRNALRNADAGSSLNDIRQDLGRIAEEADEAGNAVNGFGDKLKGVAGGLAAGGGIAAIVSQALDVSSLNTIIEITFDVPEESKKAIREAVNQVVAYGLDGEEALEGIRRQWALNKDASDESNASMIKGASMVAAAYRDIDFVELIQETNELSKIMGITDEEALALTNSLLKVGFPPDQLDIITEYGSQLKRAGYSAEEVRGILAAGVDTGTWNIDILLDGLKEGRIVMAEFGAEVDDVTAEMLKGTTMNAKQVQEWGKAVAGGGEAGKKAMQAMATELSNVKDETKKNEIGVKFFGTLWEENGENITNTLLNMGDNIVSTADMVEDFNKNVKAMDEDPAVRLKNAMGKLRETFEPVLADIAEIVAKIADWVSNNTTLVAVIGTIAGVIALIVAAFMALAPILTSVSVLMGSVGTAIAGVALPIVGVVAGIAALVAAFVYAYKESETFRGIIENVFNTIKETISAVLDTVSKYIKSKLDEIKKFWDENGEMILAAASKVWNAIKAVFDFVMPFIMGLVKDTWENIKNVIDGVLTFIMGLIKTFSALLTGDWSKMWEGIKEMLSGAVQAIWNLVELWFIGKILKIFKGFGDKSFDIIKSMVEKLKTKFDDLVNAGKTKFDSLKEKIMTPINAAKDLATAAFETLKNAISTKVDAIKSGVTTKFTAVKDAITKPIEAAKEAVGKAIDAIKGFFSNLKLKIPKPELPKMPTFSLKTSTKSVFGKDITFPSGLDIKWNAEGGIFDKPTLFNTANAGLQGVGEAGREAIIPLTTKVLSGIGEGIARTMSMQSQPQVVYVQAADVYLDGEQVGQITFDTINTKQYNTSSIKAISKGVNL